MPPCRHQHTSYNSCSNLNERNSHREVPANASTMQRRSLALPGRCIHIRFSNQKQFTGLGLPAPRRIMESCIPEAVASIHIPTIVARKRFSEFQNVKFTARVRPTAFRFAGGHPWQRHPKFLDQSPSLLESVALVAFWHNKCRQNETF
eukprot:750366-Hanusia_phi.AAC.2